MGNEKVVEDPSLGRMEKPGSLPRSFRSGFLVPTFQECCRKNRTPASTLSLFFYSIISYKLDYKPVSHLKAVYATKDDLVNPTDGSVAAFQACFLRKTFCKRIQEIKGEEELSQRSFESIFLSSVVPITLIRLGKRSDFSAQCVVTNETRLCSDLVGFGVIPALQEDVVSHAVGTSMRKSTRRTR